MRRVAAKALACDAFRDRSMAQSYTVKAAFGTRLPCEARGNPAQTRGTPQGVLRTPPCAPPLPTRRRRPLGTLVRGPSYAPNPPERLPESLVSASPHLSGPLLLPRYPPRASQRPPNKIRRPVGSSPHNAPPTQGYRASAEPSPVSNVPQRRRHTASCVQRFTCSQYAVFT